MLQEFQLKIIKLSQFGTLWRSADAAVAAAAVAVNAAN